MNTADCIGVSSVASEQSYDQLGRHCLLFENALDTAFIGSPSELPCGAAQARPRLGHIAWLFKRTYSRLIEYLARSRSRPKHDIVLASPDKVGDFAGALRLPNVERMGASALRRGPAAHGVVRCVTHGT